MVGVCSSPEEKSRKVEKFVPKNLKTPTFTQTSISRNFIFGIVSLRL